DWSLKYCDEWYGAKMDRPSRRRAQVIAAARVGDSAARDGLLGLLSNENSHYWRAVAARLLTPWAQEPAVDNALLKSLRDTNALARCNKAPMHSTATTLNLRSLISKKPSRGIQTPHPSATITQSCWHKPAITPKRSRNWNKRANWNPATRPIASIWHWHSTKP